MDPNIAYGKLGNGLSYYVGHSRAHKRAQLWLVVKAGSLHESAEQRGVANLVRRVAFDGTSHFDKQKLSDALRHWGLPQRADLNSFSGFDYTVYRLGVPLDGAAALSSGLSLLADWASAIDFEPTQVARERDMLLEERRASGAGQRVAERTLGILLQGSTLDARLPFGDEAIIERVSDQTLRRFHRDWYRPERMAVIAVGDFEPPLVASAIRERFGSLASPPGSLASSAPLVALRPGARSSFATLANAEQATDADEEGENEPEDAPDEPKGVITVSFNGARAPLRTEADLRQATLAAAYEALLESRLDLLVQRAGSPLEKAGYLALPLLPLHVSVIRAAVDPERLEPALQILMSELQRGERQGFTEAEVAHALESLKQAYATNGADPRLAEQAYFQGIMNHFLYGDAVPAVEARRALQAKIAGEIAAADVNEFAKSFLARTQRTVLVTAPADELPALNRVAKIAANVQQVH